ncbi:MAG: glycoside hydrolase family 57 protein, partial [Sphingobacteriales bacterium]
MPAAILYLKIHQPYRLKKYGFRDIDTVHTYIDAEATEAAISMASDDCYLPANKILLELLRENKRQFKIAFSISGTTLELLEKYRPDVLKSFRQLARTGYVEIMAETYYNSLSWLHCKKEFKRQIKLHDAIVKRTLGVEPKVFRNTELIYCNNLAKFINDLGYRGILCEGLYRILNGRTANHVYASPGNDDFGVLLRNVNLSDDIAFRFGEMSWSEFSLTAEKFAGWLHFHADDTTNINIFLDYETFGIYKKSETGIFDFLRYLPNAVLAREGMEFSTPSEALEKFYPTDVYNVPQTISWEDKSKENCVWCENMQQNNTLKKVYSLANLVYASDNDATVETWGKLQCADYFYYMNCDKKCNEAHPYINNPFNCPEEAYRNYTNILTDFEI